MMKTPSTYTVVVTRRDSPMPSGMFRSGFLISSETLATFVRPAYDTNTVPTVAKKPADPNAKNGVS